MTEVINADQEQDEIYEGIKGVVEYGFHMGYSFAMREVVKNLNDLIVSAEVRMMDIKEGNEYLRNMNLEITEDSKEAP